MSAAVRAWMYLVAISMRRQLASRRFLVAFAFFAMSAALVVGLGLRRPWTLESFGEWIVLRLLFLFYLPLVAVLFGAGALSDERADKTLVYLLTRPIGRCALYAGKWLAAVPWTLGLSVGGFAVLCSLAEAQGRVDLREAFPLFLPAILLGALAYLSLFHFLGALFRHAVLVALAYVFFVEAFIGRVPGILKRVSISFYTWSMVYEDAARHGIEPQRRMIFLPIDGEAARAVLVGVTAALLVLGALLFAAREWRDES